jgi:tetraprenyl-beta-curcumene synthase
MARAASNRAALGVAFVGAARRYWLSVFPCVRREARNWRRCAAEIPDPALRGLALDAQRTKRENLDGVAAFAAFVPAAHRLSVIRALTAYQVAFDYIDTISEQPGTDPVANGLRLNQALYTALEPGVAHLDYYAHHTQRDDAGYLENLIDVCRIAVGTLPSHAAVAELARRATTRIVTYQSLNHGDGNGSYDAFARWARAETAPSTGLRWWETGAAAGSPLPVLALLTAAATPDVQPEQAAAIESAYFPWIASLSTLLDSLIDHREDTVEGQRNLIDCYSSPQEAAIRLQMMAAHALCRTRALVGEGHHTMILAAMASFFHCAPQASAPDVRLATQGIVDTMGDLSTPSVLVLKVRRGAALLAEAPRRERITGRRAVEELACTPSWTSLGTRWPEIGRHGLHDQSWNVKSWIRDTDTSVYVPMQDESARSPSLMR